MATNNATNTPELTANGQTFIGSSGVNPVAATLTAGVGITISNGAGSITISSFWKCWMGGSDTGSSVTMSSKYWIYLR